MKDLKQRLNSFSPKNIFIRSWPFWIIVLTVILFFWKVFFKGLVPLPADFMVGTYYPWLDYKWGYAVGVPVKNPITTDVVSFSYPMRILAIDMMRDGAWPLWNRFILGGIPLLANFQSAPFTFTNLFYIFLNNVNGWSMQVVSQHFFAMFFMYLLLRQWRISKMSALTGGVIYAFSGFNLIWSQWNSHTLTAAFIPLIILLIEKYLKSGKIVWGAILSISVALQIFSGYPQAVLYAILIFVIYILFSFRINKEFNMRILFLAIFGVVGVIIAAPQLLPAYELLHFSQRAVEPLEFDWAFLPWVKSVTLLAPDFFGNHATKNYWGPGDYTMNTGYVGVVAISLAIISLRNLFKKNRKVKFAGIMAFLSLMLSFPTPVSIYVWRSGILGLQAASAHRALLIFIFSISILSAFGLDILVGEKKVKKLAAVFIPSAILGVYSFNALYTLISKDTATLMVNFMSRENVVVALRNMVIPWIFMLLTSTFLVMNYKFPKKLIHVILFILLTAELFRFGWKYTPFSPRRLIYPETPVISYLQDQEEPFRVTGSDVIPINMRMQYGLESLEGYDAIYPVNIAKYIAVMNSENVDATPQGRYGTVSNKYSHLLDLTNTRYILNIENEEINTAAIRGEQYEEVFRDRSVAVYKNNNVLPRAYFVENWEYEDNDLKILDKLNDEDYEYENKVLLSGSDESSTGNHSNSTINYLEYADLESKIAVKTNSEGYIFISDAYYPGWKAFVDGNETVIEKANYAFRAVKIPEGEHILKMAYEPDSFYNGLKISIASFLILVFIAIISFVKDRTVSYTNHSLDEE